MPVQRYRDVAEIPEPACARSAIEGLAAACAASRLSRAFGHATRLPRGVRRFRSVAEAGADRERRESPSSGADLRAVGEQDLPSGTSRTGGKGRSRQ